MINRVNNNSSIDALNLVIKPNSVCEECRNKTLKKVKNQYMLHGFKPSGMHM